MSYIDEAIKALREELLNQGFDASGMSDEDILQWCERAGIEISFNPSIN